MKFKLGDNVKVLSGQYSELRGRVLEITGEEPHSIQVAVVGFSPVWFTPKQIEKTTVLEKPKQIEHPDLTELRATCAEWIDLLAGDNYQEDEDDTHEIFERAVEAIYGKHVWDYINERLT